MTHYSLRNELDTALFKLPTFNGGQATGAVVVSVAIKGSMLDISITGYGDPDNDDGAPISIEHYNGQLRVITFPNINSHDPTIVEMEGARNEARTDV
jgi:hypothetical protein